MYRQNDRGVLRKWVLLKEKSDVLSFDGSVIPFLISFLCCYKSENLSDKFFYHYSILGEKCYEEKGVVRVKSWIFRGDQTPSSYSYFPFYCLRLLTDTRMLNEDVGRDPIQSLTFDKGWKTSLELFIGLSQSEGELNLHQPNYLSVSSFWFKSLWFSVHSFS